MTLPSSGLQLADVKQFLNMQRSDNDVVVQLIFSSAERMWQDRGGPLSETTAATEWYDGGLRTISLRHAPVATISNIVETIGTTPYTLHNVDPGTPTSSDAWAYTIDPVTATLTRRAAGVAIPFAAGSRNIAVTYTWGYPVDADGKSTVPSDIQLAILMLVQHLYESQRGGATNPNSGGDQTPMNPGLNFAWPYKVQDILRAHTTPGVA